MRKLARRLLPIGPLLLIVSCSASYEVRFEVSIDEGVDVVEGAQVGFILHEQGEGTVDSSSPVGHVPAEVGVATYEHKAHACCAPYPTVMMFAFLDENANGLHDPGEPWGADPANPIKLTDPREVHVAKIVIAPAS